jgi:hypothetical protein
LRFPSITQTIVKNQRQKELTLLNEMRQNLQIDLKDLDYNIKESAKRIQANEIILKAVAREDADA